MAWSERQAEAINITGVKTVVSASAGAGKTSVLVSRLVKRCIEDGVSLDRMIAMTFTDAAAAEMKKRLSKSLSEEYQKTPSDYLKNQLVLLQSAKISTIHSFCLSIIQQYSDILALDPAIAANLLSDGRVALLKDAAFEDVLQAYALHSPQKVIDVANHFSTRGEDYTGLKDAVLKIMSVAHSSFDEDKWYAIQLQKNQPITYIKDLDPEILNYWFRGIKISVNKVIHEHQAYYDAIVLVNDQHKVLKDVEKRISLMNQALEALDSYDYQGFLNLLHMAAEVKLSQVRGVSDELKDLKTNLNEIKSLCKKYFEPEVLIKAHNENYPLIETLFDLAKLTQKRFSELKLLEKGMDFDDMEHFAYAILKANNEATAKQLRPLYDEILVDEFQDTSEIQYAIIDLISREDNLFIVGDVKQSIYRFRKAKPDLMRSLIVDPTVHTICLDHNYRSKDHIVQFNNRLFDRCMNIPDALDTYTSGDYVTSGRDAQFEYLPDTIKFYGLLDNNSGMSSKQIKADFIASKIQELHRIRKNSSYRDYVILVRSHGDKGVIKKAFDTAGIPYSIDAKEGFYQSEIVQIIYSYLKLIADPSDEIALASVLLSPYYEMSEEALAKLVIEYGGLYETIDQLAINHDIEVLRQHLEESGIDRVMIELMKLNNVYDYKLSKQQRTNFDLLYQNIVSFMNQGLTFREILDELEMGQDEKSSEASSVGKEDDVVRVVTIHQSKGLQYKVVFFWSNSMFRMNEKADGYYLDADLGFGMKYFNQYRIGFPTPMSQALEIKLSQDELEENIRLLYVALTRAEEELYLIDYMKEEIAVKEWNLSRLFERKGFTDIILSSLGNDEFFTVEYLDNYESFSQHVRPVTPIIELPHCEDTLYRIEIITPSSEESADLSYFNTHRSKGMNKGTYIHQCIEQLPDRKWVIDDFKAFDLLTEQDCHNLLSFSESAIYTKALTYEIHKEYPFFVTLEDKIINGTMDFIAIGEKEAILIDFKTDHDIKDIKERYEKQVDLYKRALEKLYPDKEIKAYLYALGHQKTIDMN
ncbi:MAG: UvrD-helicase domain-containing protein [Erysipelotrichaceae bacterium]|nr:UvrD-helicase domain-containing protein [Erysipelotrichaceae bacterium]